jgi:lantibiotic modifying enzyme
VRRAEMSAGYSWRGDPESYYNLTGISHGASGIAYALLELFQVTDSFKFKNSAMEAFRYERQWFDTKISNWQDLRGSRKNLSTKKFVNFWCHGAPGIALSRMHAYKILNEEFLKKEAIAGLKSTLISTKEILNTSINDFTLCHGLAGITDVLYHGLYELGDEWTDDTEVPFLVAETGKDLYSKNNLPWPCGSLGVDFPGLLRGLAGIGYFYLRLYDPKIQSVLMLEPQKF